MYLQGYSSIQLAEMFNVGRATILRYLSKKGIQRRSCGEGRQRKLSKKHFENVCRLYLEGLTTREISERYGVSRQTIANCLKDHNIKVRQASEYNKKYSCDSTFFKNIDTEEKAYWLGFIMADGCIVYHKKIGHALTIQLNAVDKEHLYLFKQSLRATHPIFIRKHHQDDNRETATIRIINNKLCRDLIKFGCVLRKTSVLKFPDVDKSLIHHFIRGYFDGDGSIRVDPKGQWSFEIIGTMDFLNHVQNILIEACGVKPKKIYNYGTYYELTYKGNKQAPRIFHWLYRDATIYLSRKYQKYKLLCQELGCP